MATSTVGRRRKDMHPNILFHVSPEDGSKTAATQKSFNLLNLICKGNNAVSIVSRVVVFKKRDWILSAVFAGFLLLKWP